jgi:beta-glucosidase
MNGEGSSRADITIPDAQQDLLRALKATGKPLVVVLVTGRPLILNWEAENADAILCTWSLGAEAGRAIADVLFGDVNPSGKLTTSFPRSVGQLPLYYNHKNTGRPWGDTEPYRKFFSCYQDVVNGPLYNFGYGLSYTTFSYNHLRLSKNKMTRDEKIVASIDVTNTGDYDGDEIVQLYIRDLAGSVARPVMELKGFERIHLKKGETRTVIFTIDEELLRFYNSELQFVSEPGEFQLMVGPNSRDVQTLLFSLE